MAESISVTHLRNLVAQIERLEEDKAGIAEDIKEVYAEAKGMGYDPKIIRKVVALRKRNAQQRAEEDELLRIYLEAVDEQLNLFEKPAADDTLITISSPNIPPITGTSKQFRAALDQMATA